MSVLIETNMGNIVVDLFTKDCPNACLNFLKLCKLKYYNGVLFYHVEKDFIAQTGDPTATGEGGTSIWGKLHGKEKRFFNDEICDHRKHDAKGTLAMASAGPDQNSSIFYITLRPRIDFLNKKHTVFGEIVEDEDEVLKRMGALHCDDSHRPYIDTRISHTYVLDDPFPDPKGFPTEPPASPQRDRPADEAIEKRIAHGEKLDEHEGKTEEEVAEAIAIEIAKSKAKTLRDLGDIPHEDFVPADNILFVCKLNPATNDDDLELIFSRFGEIKSCEIIRDKKTGDSLQYAFISFETRQACEEAYLKMDNVQIDDRRIHVDFTQSVGSDWNKYQNNPWQQQGGPRGRLGDGSVRIKSAPNHQYGGGGGAGGKSYKMVGHGDDADGMPAPAPRAPRSTGSATTGASKREERRQGPPQREEGRGRQQDGQREPQRQPQREPQREQRYDGHRCRDGARRDTGGGSGSSRRGDRDGRSHTKEQRKRSSPSPGRHRSRRSGRSVADGREDRHGSRRRRRSRSRSRSRERTSRR